MKKNLISLAVAASVVSTAQAGVFVNPEGTGEVLMFPFYNADNGNATNMHIVNTTDAVKAVKVRFVEYKNSYEVLDFNLYLSPKDHFAFGVIKDPNGTGGAVITSDNSCTVPALGSANGDFTGTATTQADGSVVRIQPFVNYKYAAKKNVDSSIERTLTGHVEVIEMGVVADVGTPSATSKTMYASFATHGATGVPANCAGLDAAWASGTWATNAFGTKTINNVVYESGVSQATGGLYGLSYHINVEAAAAFAIEPTAIDDFYGATSSTHTDPGSEAPSLGEGQAVAVVHSDGGDQYVEMTFDSGAQAVSATIATSTLSNDVMVNPAIGGMTDWVVTFPTKRLHVDVASASAVIPPFTDNWVGAVLQSDGVTYKEDPACETVTIDQWDREEAFTANSNQFSPKPVTSSSKICNEVAVIATGTAGTASALSASTGVINLGFPYAEGWQRFTFAQKTTDGDGATGSKYLTGLPAIGFAAYKVNNGAMSYGNTSVHKTAAVYS